MERPILFSGPMVRAILEGRKSQTRRIVKPVPDGRLTAVRTLKNTAGDVGALFTEHDGDLVGQNVSSAWSRHGNPGDRLWVRETHAVCEHGPSWDGGVYQPYERWVLYKADTSTSPNLRFRPSIHMPRWASRITLEVESVRVERLQDISVSDAIAEGVSRYGDYWRVSALSHPHINPEDAYCELWESINGPGSWEANPWVWVIGFRRI